MLPAPEPIPCRASPSLLRWGLLLLWFVVSFGGVFFARDLQWTLAGWPLAFWFSAQGALLVFVGIVAVYAWLRNRRPELADAETAVSLSDPYRRRLRSIFVGYVLGLLLFLLCMALAEQAGLPRRWLGALFLLFSIGLYSVVGIYCRTADADEYYVAGRRVPAIYNGMATAADWMSAASFISLAGGLYLHGFSGSGEQPGGLAYVLGWTGGFCLVALLIAPRLRQMGLYTVPDFFGQRFGGRWPRRMAALAAVLCSFTYLVAQIYGVGLISSRLTGVQFEMGILLGLGGVLVCSFLGGMRAVTWTQVAQYVILTLAFLLPVSWLAYQQLGNPLAPLVAGQQLAKIAALEQRLMTDPAEQQVIAEYARRAHIDRHRLQDVDAALARERSLLQERLRRLTLQRADAALIFQTSRELALLPKDAVSARARWSQSLQDNQERARPLAGMPLHAQAFAGDPAGTPEQQQAFQNSRLNFLALMFCLMVGTAGLPHLLTRFYTAPSVAETRRSVAWSLFFIGLLYVAAPALAILVKYEVMSHLVGLRFDALPTWMGQWIRVDPALLSVSDVNGDGILQFSEIRLGADIVMLATPELGGLPYVVSGLVAAGGLAAALSTADGLLLTIGNALAHDLYFEGRSDRDSGMQRVMLSKFALLLVALAAAYVAAQKPADILYLVSASFSLAASAFVPAMVLGMYWRSTSHGAAVAGMLAGFSVTIYYMLVNAPILHGLHGGLGSGLWFGIQPVSAAVFGVPAGFVVTWCVSLLTRWLAPRGL